VIATRLDDPKAVYLAAPQFGVHADGTSDDSAAMQAAIDKAESSREGIVFVPSGRYRLARTVFVWPGVRVFGYGDTRPVFVLAPNTPGFQKGVAGMVSFTGFRVPFPPPDSVPPNPAIADANSGTFYSAMSNIDFEIGPGNPAAVAVRFHVAQHAFLSPAVIVSNENSPLTEVGFENAVLKDVPVFALLRESGKQVAGKGPVYRVRNFKYGLIVPGLGVPGSIGMIYDAAPLAAMPEPLPPAIPALPPSTDWVNVRSLGNTGDGTTDDTAAIQKAIDTRRVLYFPSGHYAVRDTLALRPDTVLIGLHPTATQFDLSDGAPAFQGVGAPRAVISAPAGGRNILSGFGVLTGGINPRAVGVLWRAGEASLIDDVRFLGGHGSGTNPYNNNHTADPDLRKRWDSQYPSLWVTDGGGGTFADIWTPDTFAQAGFYVSNTKTPGHVYELSNEHHVRLEIKLDHVENWDLNAPQTEEESGESAEALSLEISYSKNITIANYHGYRVTRSRAPFPAAVRLYHSSDIRFRNLHVNAESGYAVCDENGCGTFLRVSKFPYENAIEDVTHHLEVREREFAVLDVPAEPARPAPGKVPVRKLEDGFSSISGAAVDPAGKLYFVDHHDQRIYGWSAGEGLTIERDAPLDPVNLAFDKSGNLLVLSSFGPQGTVYSFRPGTPHDQITVLEPRPTQPHPGARAVLPVNYWNNGEFKTQLDFDTFVYKTLAQMFAEDVSTPKAKQYVSPDGSLFLPAGRVFQQGPADSTAGWRFSDNLDTYGFLTAAPGERIYVSSESEDVTYSASVAPDGALTGLRPFANRGGESVAVDRRGNVYIANGQIFVHDPSGRLTTRIDVHERPLQLVFGGPGGRTLFILAHHALFAVDVRPVN
jgi:hypothetical protein